MLFVLHFTLERPPCTMHVEHFEKGLRYSDRELLTLARKIGKMATYCKTEDTTHIRVLFSNLRGRTLEFPRSRRMRLLSLRSNVC